MPVFARDDEVRDVRSRILDDNINELKSTAGVNSTGQRMFEFDKTVANLRAQQEIPGQKDLLDYDASVVDLQADADARYANLQRKAAAMQLVRPPTEPERNLAQEAVANVTGAAFHGLDAVLNIVDAPRKWTFENLIIPAAKRAGAIDPNAKVDPYGKDLYLHAFGGDKEQWWKDRAAEIGLDEGWKERVAGGSTLVAGLGLDILLDPINYLTLGAGFGIKAGGRALAKGGIELANLSRAKGILVGTDAAKLEAAAMGLTGPLSELTTTATELSRTANTSEKAFGAARTAAREAEELTALQAKLLQGSRGTDILKRSAPNLTEPDVDRMFKYLRGSGVDDDLFKAGGATWTLPFNSAGFHVPFLNKEETLGVFLGGRDITPAQFKRFDDMRRTAIELGEGALARVPVPKKLQDAGSKLRDVFVPYGYLQGYGSDALKNVLKEIARVPRVEENLASRSVAASFGVAGDLKPEQMQRIHYLLDIGATRTDRAGRVVYQSLDDLADEMNKASGFATSRRVKGPNGKYARVFDPNTVTGADVKGRLEEQILELNDQLNIARDPEISGFRPEIQVQALPGLRDPAMIPAKGATSLPAADMIQNMIDRVQGYIDTERVPQRLVTRDLIADPVRFAAVEPDEKVRKVIEALHEEERNVFGAVNAKGPIAAITQAALDFGQQGMLPNYLRHIYDIDLPAVRAVQRRAAAAGGLAKPKNLGKGRTATFLAEPEELAALGVSASAPDTLKQTLAQYRIMTKQRAFISNVVEQYGKPFVKGSVPPEGWTIFEPNQIFQRRLPSDDVLEQQLDLLRQSGNITKAEVDSLRGIAAERGANAGKWLMPTEVVRGLDEAANVSKSAGGLASIVDSYIGILRAGVTTIWPSYHVRNLVGNIYNSHLGGVKMTDTVALSDAIELMKGEPSNTIFQRVMEKIAQTGVKLGPAELIAQGDEARAIGQLGNAATANAGTANRFLGPLSMIDPASSTARDDMLRFLSERGVLDTGRGDIETASKFLMPDRSSGGIANKVTETIFDRGRRLSSYTDNLMRVRHFLGRMYQGDTVEEAVMSVRKHLFDFGDLTPTERGVFRRAAFFYTWTRKNVPLQLEMIIHQPRNAAYWNAFLRNASDEDAQKDADAALMPAFIREQLGVVMGSDERGRVTVLQGLGLPIEDLNTFSWNSPQDAVARLVGETNPLFRGLAELGGMPSAFTGKRIDDDALSNYYRKLNPTLGWVASNTPGLRDWLDVKEREIINRRGEKTRMYTADPAKLYILSNLVPMTGRFASMVNQGGKIQEEFQNSPEEGVKEAAVQALRVGTGVRATTVDLSRPLDTLESSLEGEQLDADINDRMEILSEQFRTREITAKEWRDRRGDLLDERRYRREQLLQSQLNEEPVKISKDDRASIEAVRRRFRDAPGQMIAALQDLDPFGTNPLTQERFTGMDEFFTTREQLQEAINEASPEQAKRFEAVKAQTRERMKEGSGRIEDAYQYALDLFQEYNETPKYLGVPQEEYGRVDKIRQLVRVYSRQLGSPAKAKAEVRRRDPEGYRLLQRSRMNTRERQKVWAKLDRESRGMLTRFFGDVPQGELDAFEAGLIEED